MATTKQDIQQAIERFKTGDLRQNALSLFKILGYNTERENGLDTPQYKTLKDTYELTLNEEKAKVNEWIYVDVLFQLSQNEMIKQVSLFDTRKIDQTIIESYLFFTIECICNSDAYCTLTKKKQSFVFHTIIGWIYETLFCI